MQPKDRTCINIETSKQEAPLTLPTPLQWTIPTSFAELFSPSSLPCLSFVGYQLCCNFVIDNMVSFITRDLCVGQFAFYG
jgi:hypothetical protein